MLTGSRRRLGLLAVLMALVLGLSMIGAGSRIAGGLTIEGAALRDHVGGDQAFKLDAPGQPPPRLLEGELRKDNHDDSDSRTETTALARDPHESRDEILEALVSFEIRSEASLRVGEGLGARGPPAA
ncbi:MAG TPA: hypothetical protein VK034_14885 [Enhygromyxa sp.]|nr:hypothetical protein [Enhygromyxa sp.]